ncbi:MAG TPA: hypothetical protein DIT07_12540, partial [Sphingobacteriaceae bacterium]|nr:hypothetical protein [Sphingobacteriaceae bacterium]
RLTAIMKKINLEDQTEARGYRAILISTQRKYLKGFNFNKNQAFKSIFTQPLALENLADRSSASVILPQFDPRNSVYPPVGATHFRIVHALAVISDYAFNATTKAYEPIAFQENELSAVSYSGYIPVDQATAAVMTIEADLAPPAAISADASVLQCIGIEFFQKVGVQYANLYAAGALHVAEIF